MWLKSFGESKTPLLPSRKHFLHALHFRACFLLLIEPLSHIIRDVTSRSPPGEAEQELRADEDKSRWWLGTGELFFFLRSRWLSRGTRSTWSDRPIARSVPQSDIIHAIDPEAGLCGIYLRRSPLASSIVPFQKILVIRHSF